MKERETNRAEYTDLEKHKYKGVEFFTAVYNDHIVLEPVHQEVVDMMNISWVPYSSEPYLWHDSAHSWAGGLTLQGQRNRLIEYAQNDIDYILSGDSLKEQREDYLKKRKKVREQFEFFKALRKELRNNDNL